MTLKKKLTILLLGLILILIPFIKVGAQSELDDYNFQYEKYTSDYQNFIRAKDEYVKYQTLNSKEQLIDTLQVLVVQQAEAQRSYFLLLRKRLRNSAGLIVDEKNKYISRLTEQVIFLERQKNNAANLDNPTLQDLLIIVDELESRDNDNYQLSYESISFVLLGKERDVLAETVSINSLFDQELSTLDVQQQNFFTSWVEEARSQTLDAEKTLNNVLAKIAEFKKKRKADDSRKHFNIIKELLDESNQYITQSFSYQKELLEKMEK